MIEYVFVYLHAVCRTLYIRINSTTPNTNIHINIDIIKKETHNTVRKMLTLKESSINRLSALSLSSVSIRIIMLRFEIIYTSSSTFQPTHRHRRTQTKETAFKILNYYLKDYSPGNIDLKSSTSWSSLTTTTRPTTMTTWWRTTTWTKSTSNRRHRRRRRHYCLLRPLCNCAAALRSDRRRAVARRAARLCRWWCGCLWRCWTPDSRQQPLRPVRSTEPARRSARNICPSCRACESRETGAC